MYKCLFSFLNMGVIFADFRDPGNRPIKNDLLMILAKGADNRFPPDLNTATARRSKKHVVLVAMWSRHSCLKSV